MRRPVQLGNRNATTSACVGWDDLNIENQFTVCKPVARPQGRSERLYDHQNDDQDHQDSRYFIDNTIKFLAVLVPLSSEIPHPA